MGDGRSAAPTAPTARRRRGSGPVATAQMSRRSAPPSRDRPRPPRRWRARRAPPRCRPRAASCGRPRWRSARWSGRTRARRSPPPDSRPRTTSGADAATSTTIRGSRGRAAPPARPRPRRGGCGCRWPPPCDASDRPSSRVSQTPIRSRSMSGRLLLVEDDALLASSLSRALAANGYTVAVSHTVAEALAAVDESVPDLVLLDLGLPDGDGDEVCEHMVAQPPARAGDRRHRTDRRDRRRGRARPRGGRLRRQAVPPRRAAGAGRAPTCAWRVPPQPRATAPGGRDTLVDRRPHDRPRRPPGARRRRGARVATQGVRRPRPPRPRRRHGRHARAADRRRVGRELVGVDEDPRRPHQQHPAQARRAVG